MIETRGRRGNASFCPLLKADVSRFGFRLGHAQAAPSSLNTMNRHGSMNRAYRLIWTTVPNVWIPVAEKTRGRGSRACRKLVVATLSLGAAYAQAGGPSGGQVIAGSSSIAQSGPITTIT